MAKETSTPEEHAGADWAQQAWLWPLEATRLALQSYGQWFADPASVPSSAPDRKPLDWTTPNEVVLQLTSMQLRAFSHGKPGQQPALVCAPYALHGALIADFAPGHSLVEALQKDGVDRVYVPDWRSAVPDMRYLSIDNYLADLNVAVDEIGAPVDLVGLCQGGWLSLVYAARFPGKVRRLVLAGAPVDISTPSDLSRMVAALPQAGFEQMVQQGGGLVSGEHMLRLWNLPFNQHDVEAALQRTLGDGSDDGRMLLDRYACWDRATLDLPGAYYLEVTERIFRQNQIAEGRFVALGHRIDLTKVRDAGLPAGGSGRHRRPARPGVRHRAVVGHTAGVAGTGLRAVRPPQPFHGARGFGPVLAPDRAVASGRPRRGRRHQDQGVSCA